jgi:hypothetical protein
MFNICSNAYGAAPATYGAAPAGGPDHVDYGAYTGGELITVD